MQDSLTKTVMKVAARVLPPNTARYVHVPQTAPQVGHDAPQIDVHQSLNKNSSNFQALLPDGDHVTCSRAVRSRVDGLTLGLGADDVDDLVRRSQTTPKSLSRNVDERAATIVSEIVQSLQRSTSPIVRH